MLDPLLLKNDLDSLKDNLKRRNLDVDLEQLIELDESRRKLRFEAEKLRADQKSLGKDIANAEPKEKDYIDAFEEAEKALYGGLQDLNYSISSLLTEGIDATFDTNYLNVDKIV